MSERLHEPCRVCSEMRTAREIFVGVCHRRSFSDLIPPPVKCSHCVNGTALTDEGRNLLKIFAELIDKPFKDPAIPF